MRQENPNLVAELEKGGRFRQYDFCFSVVVLTITLKSRPILVRAGESPRRKGLPYLFISILAGWWGLPMGPIRTIACIIDWASGGVDVTETMSKQLTGAEKPYEKWDCPKCGHLSPNTTYSCTRCGYSLI
ncbi:MAG: hypothetical protein M0R80_30940 [Proteobacteria bacterium]|jgi:hypothetical protein|nr:hypothetical protein [Pseudomonadota bacterium]